MKATPKKRARQSLAFQGWWKRYGNQFACTPVPEQLRINIAEYAFRAGWNARAARAQRRALGLDAALRDKAKIARAIASEAQRPVEQGEK